MSLLLFEIDLTGGRLPFAFGAAFHPVRLLPAPGRPTANQVPGAIVINCRQREEEEQGNGGGHIKNSSGGGRGDGRGFE